MECQKIINLLDNTANQQTKFRTKNWVEINDDVYGTYNNNQIKLNQFKFKTSMLKSSLCNYSGSGTITVPNIGTAANSNNRKNIIIKNCAPFTDCIIEMNNTQKDNTKDTDIVLPMYNFI